MFINPIKSHMNKMYESFPCSDIGARGDKLSQFPLNVYNYIASFAFLTKNFMTVLHATFTCIRCILQKYCSYACVLLNVNISGNSIFFEELHYFRIYLYFEVATLRHRFSKSYLKFLSCVFCASDFHKFGYVE